MNFTAGNTYNFTAVILLPNIKSDSPASDFKADVKRLTLKSKEFRSMMGPCSHYNVHHRILGDCVLSGEGTVCYRAEFAGHNVTMCCIEKCIAWEYSRSSIFTEKIR